MNTSNTQLSQFQCPDIAWTSIQQTLPCLCERLNLDGADRNTFGHLFKRAIDAGAERIVDCRQRGLIDPTPESRELLDFLEGALIGSDSQLVGAEHLEAALEYMKQGGNVLMLQNHTSGADTLVWDKLVNTNYDGAARTFGYMAGHVVTVYLVPFAITNGLRMFQIFASKFKQHSEAVGMTADDMTRQNMRSLKDLYKHTRTGGRLVGLYPEGGRGEGRMLYGDPNTVAIGRTMSRASTKELMVLPTWIAGATSILPVVRGEREFVQFMNYAKPGSATVTCGALIPWSQLSQDQTDTQISTHERTMRALASLAPEGEARGVWQ